MPPTIENKNNSGKNKIEEDIIDENNTSHRDGLTNKLHIKIEKNTESSL